jgi:hypothetical protein
MLLPDARPGCEPVRLLPDHEPQRANEGEVADALRLLEGVIGSYPRAFDLVLADALYGTAPFFNFLLARGKHALVLLKDERRNLFQDAAALFAHVLPREGSCRSRRCLWRSFAGNIFGSPPVRRQGRAENQRLDLGDHLSAQGVSTERADGFGHQTMGYRESRVQRTRQRLACRPHLPARPQRHRVLSDRSLS